MLVMICHTYVTTGVSLEANISIPRASVRCSKHLTVLRRYCSTPLHGPKSDTNHQHWGMPQLYSQCRGQRRPRQQEVAWQVRCLWVLGEQQLPHAESQKTTTASPAQTAPEAGAGWCMLGHWRLLSSGRDQLVCREGLGSEVQGQE